MKKDKKIRLIDVKIQELSANGNGFATYDHPAGMQWLVEVPFTRPGDLVRARLLKKRGGIYQCKLEELLEPAAERNAPKCPHFASCGGCRWQHLSYQEQLTQKETNIKRSFAPLLTSEVTFFPIAASPKPWEYRNKMEFSFSANSAGDKFLGLMMDSSRGRVLNLSECHLVDNWFMDALKAVRLWWSQSTLAAYHPYKDSGTLRTLTLREGQRSGQKLAMLTVSGNPDYAMTQQQVNEFVNALQSAVNQAEKPPISIFLRIQQIAKGRPTEFFEMHLAGSDTIEEELFVQPDSSMPSVPLKFSISPSAFFQPNTVQAEKIYSLVLQMAKIPSDAVVYDLYCGTGTLGICMAKHVKEVIGVELSRESAHDAKANIQLNGISNMRIITGDVGDVLEQIKQQGDTPSPDVVVVDPPRAGLDPQAIRLLLGLKPATLVYVSCNPVTQAANILELVQGGYRLESLQPVDQFPQTVHVENIAILKNASLS